MLLQSPPPRPSTISSRETNTVSRTDQKKIFGQV
jgi:hypothetical protein